MRCNRCGGILTTTYSVTGYDCAAKLGEELPGIWRHAELLPVQNLDRTITLGEGNTPLIESARIASAIGLQKLLFKNEASNPTGSYKDRIATVAISLARERSRQGWVATSSGNAGAALAAYGARSGMLGVLIVPTAVSIAKLAQILTYGPNVIAVDSFLDRAEVDHRVFEILARADENFDLELSITAHAYSPLAMDGAKAIAYEIAEAIGDGVDRVYLPAGGGGLASAVIRGFQEYLELGIISRLPLIVAAQADGCAPIVNSFRAGGELETVETITTTISGVQLGAPPDGDLLLQLLRQVGGEVTSVSDDFIYSAQARLAREEGLFVEPAAALSVAALIADFAADRIKPDESVVCVLTGSGFKVREAIERMANVDQPIREISVDSLEQRLNGLVAPS